MSDSLVKVLIVDDSPEDRATLRRYLERTTPRQFAVIDANTGEEAFEMCREHCPDAILLDYNLPDIGGIEWLIEFMEGEGKFSCPVIMITGQGDETVAAQSILEGAQDYLVKGKITPVSLVHVIEGALKNYRLQREVSLLQTVVTHTSEPIVITEAEPIDMPGPRIIYVNQAFTQMTGYTAEEVIGQTPRILQGKNTCQQGRDTIRRALEAWEPVRVEMLNYRKDGTEFWVELAIVPVANAAGWYTHWVSVQKDITERKRQQEALELANKMLADANVELQHQISLVNEQSMMLELQQSDLKKMNSYLEELAMTDGLTGLTNHRTFQERMNQECLRSQRQETSLSMLLLDVDKFKQFNDTFGHPAGDVVLKQVAAILKECARKTDIVARYGGEEFAIVLVETSAEEAMQFAEKVRTAIENADWTQRPMTVSIGVGTLQANMTASELVQMADRALYFSKESGRNCANHFNTLPADTDELRGNVSQPYASIINEMMQMQTDALRSASDQLRSSMAEVYDATIISWSHLLDLKDKETEGHSRRVTHMMMMMAKHIGMNADELLYARWGALLHDVGKMGVPDDILHKPGPLTEDEWIIMRSHTTIAHELLYPVTFLRPAIDIPYGHHEKWDGTGYPRGLAGDDIPLSARLFAVADVYDALSNDRPYRKAWSHEKTMQHIVQLSGTHFDPRAVKVFLTVMEEAKPLPKAA